MSETLPLEVPQQAPDDDRFKELERRIAELEQLRDNDALSFEANIRMLVQQEITQRIHIRWLALTLSVLIAAFMAILTWRFQLSYATNALTVAMFVAPVASITTITIMLVVGAFRRKGEDMDGSPAANLAADYLKSSASS